MNDYALALIIFPPLAGAAINWLIGRRVRSEAFIGLVACGAVFVSTIFAFYCAFFRADAALISMKPILNHLWTWIQVGSFRADFGLAMDRLSGIYACFVTFVALLIHIFAVGYMHGDKGFYRFFAYLNLFMFMMLTLVLADNLLLMFVGWEGVGLCSYLLIGYYFDRKEAADAAKKAFVANRIGDWGVVLGIMAIFFITSQAGRPSISFFDKPAQGVASALATIGAMHIEPFTLNMLWAGGITSAAILLFIGATGKSAQIPLFVWLPDAMAGPTPVSALIHAATMVTAGVYMIVRCSQIYVHAPMAMAVVAIVGALTAIVAATIGLGQNDIKKVLAYSTVSQLGYMVLACGVGAFVAAIFHVMTHAFFKALLFLGSGSVIHGMHEEQDMRRMGNLRKYMPITFITMMMGWLAICGVPFWAGFFSKDEILWKTWSTDATAVPAPMGKILWGIGAVTALITAVYMTRLMIMTFFGRERFDETHAGGEADEAHAQTYDKGEAAHEASHASVAGSETHDAHAGASAGHGKLVPHESPLIMTLPLIILAVLSTVGGFIGVPYALSSIIGLKDVNVFERTLEPVVANASGREREEGLRNNASLGGARRETDSNAPAGESASPRSIGEGREGEPELERTHSPEEVGMERLFTGISVIIAFAGIGLAGLLFWRTPLRQMPKIFERKYYVDEIYDATLVHPIENGSRSILWRFFDLGIIDGIVNGLGRSMIALGQAARYVQAGFVRGYAALILFGALVIIGYFAYYGTQIFAR
jgi:NADH-quinone oxidoreductase subunit L